ncbi:MAG: hypothetical protein AAF696_16505 [Bacteroidota bacterium]
MCITSGAAALYATIVGTWDIDHPAYGYRHVLAYQNIPHNFSKQANSMILPIPTHEALTPDQLLDTSEDPHLLKQIADQVAPIKKAAEFTRSRDRQDVSAVFEMGIYRIVMLNEVSQEALAICLAKVPKEKRPEISPDLLGFYQKTYPRYPLMICCFSTRKEKETSPILLHYKPAHPDTFMLNFVEAHGKVPVLGKAVEAHQRIIISSHRVQEAFGDYKALKYQAYSEHLKDFLPIYAQGEHLNTPIPNYDLLINNRKMGESDKLKVRFRILA